MKASYCTFAYEGRQVLKNKRTKHCDTMISKKEIFLRKKIHMVGFKLKQAEKNVVLINGFHFEHAKNSLTSPGIKYYRRNLLMSVVVCWFTNQATAVHFQTLNISTLYVTKLIKLL